MRTIFIILIFFCSSMLTAQNETILFNKANNFYKTENYQEAINSYEALLDSNIYSSEIYYNLANSYYKLNKVAASIYNYEKALQLNPLNEDAAVNLALAKRLTLDRIEVLPKSVFQKINEAVFQKFSYTTWAVLSVVFSFATCIFFLLFYFGTVSNAKRMYFTTSIVLLLMLLASVSISFNQYALFKNTKYAILFPEKIAVKNAPNATAETVFVLHEGTKVRLIDSVDMWTKIKLTDGKIGWVLKKDAKEI